MTQQNEFIICSAIWFDDGEKYPSSLVNIESGFVAQGRRHHDCRYPLVGIFYPNWRDECELPHEEQPRLRVLNNEVQGFITNTGRFVTREEGLIIATKADQLIKKTYGDKLYSEDLY